MASTDDGRALTEAHRQQQLAISAAAATEASALWGRLDPTDLDGSTPYWLASNTIAVNRRVLESQRTAGAYLTAYREAEIGLPAAVVTRGPLETARALLLAGPVRVKRLIGLGLDREEAAQRAFAKYSGIVRRQTLMGGRLTIDATVARDRVAIGWRRVTDGNPCAFCAMLASRGPVYRSKESGVSGKLDPIYGAGLRYHGHCGCTGEPVYGSWEPDDREREYVDAYLSAEGKNTKEILASMRRNGSFRDSPSP